MPRCVVVPNYNESFECGYDFELCLMFGTKRDACVYVPGSKDSFELVDYGVGFVRVRCLQQKNVHRSVDNPTFNEGFGFGYGVEL